MRSFRFPIWMIAMMMTVLVSVIIAIEKARVLSIESISGSTNVPDGWWTIPAVFVLTAVLSGTVAVIGLGLMKVLRR